MIVQIACVKVGHRQTPIKNPQPTKLGVLLWRFVFTLMFDGVPGIPVVYILVRA